MDEMTAGAFEVWCDLIVCVYACMHEAVMAIP